VPFLSVCITHYNRPEKLATTLETLANQTRPPDEVLLWDDHSPRDPTEVARAFEGRFRRFVYRRNPANLGMPGNLNSVIREARGDLIANLHDADEFHPELLELWERALASHPSAGIAFCGLDAKSRARTRGKTWLHDFGPLTSGRDFFERAYVGASGSPIWGTVMARRSVYERHLPFDERFGPWADVDMWMRVCGTHDIAYVRRLLITLDDSETAFRQYRWEKVRMLHAMHFMNIRRMARDQSELARWLARQRRHTLGRIIRHLLSPVSRVDMKRTIKGLSMTPDWIRLLSGHDDRVDLTVPLGEDGSR
jgi:glycosyltransferase involved in cell wall biosynthesis